MPAVHDQPTLGLSREVEEHESNPKQQHSETDPDTLSEQIVDHLLRELEARRLPEALAIHDQILHGEALGIEDQDRLDEMVQVVDQGLRVLRGQPDLLTARRHVVRLREGIITSARANGQTVRAV
jgi:hypothetical protein